MTTGFNDNKITIFTGDETGAVWRDRVLEELVHQAYILTSGDGDRVIKKDIAPPETNLQLFPDNPTVKYDRHWRPGQGRKHRN